MNTVTRPVAQRQYLAYACTCLFIVVLAGSPAAEPVHQWSQRFGGPAGDVGQSVAVAADGTSVITGTFQDVANFGGTDLTSAGSNDIFLAAFDANGTHLWSRAFGDTGNDEGLAVAIDASGHTIVTGRFFGNVDFGGGALTSAGLDIFVAKYDASGNHLWSGRFGGTGVDGGRGVTVDGSDNVIVVGSFQSAVDFGGGPLTSAGLDDIFVAKYDAGGSHLWSRRFGDTDVDSGRAVAVGASNNVVMTGAFAGSVEFGGGTLTSAGMSDIFVASYDATGTHLWSRHFGDGLSDAGEALAVDANDDIVVSGAFQVSVDFGGAVLAGAGGDDIFLVKFAPDAGHVWSRSFGSLASDIGLGVTVDTAGDVSITGQFSSIIDLGGGPLTTNGSTDIFIAEYSENGTHLWSQGYGNT